MYVSELKNIRPLLAANNNLQRDYDNIAIT